MYAKLVFRNAKRSVKDYLIYIVTMTICVTLFYSFLSISSRYYPSDSIVFSSHGYDLHIDNELVAEAFSALPQTEQSILILHCTLDLADGEIGNLVGMSRSAVQRHRTKALQELREALSALMPKGG